MDVVKHARRRASGWYGTPATVVFVVLLVANVIADPTFASPSNWPATFATVGPYVLVAMAVTPAIMAGGAGVDLSVGPLAGFTAAVIVTQLEPNGLASPLLLIPIVLVMGAAIGLVNGFAVSYVRLPPIVATLGAYLFLTGWVLKVLPTAGGTAPGWLADLSGGLGPIPGVWLLFALVAIGWIALRRSAYGRNLLAVGGDERAAFTAGVDVARVRMIAYVIAGAIAAVAGMAFVANLQAADPNVGPPFTLIALAGAALGGISLAGGRGGLLGAALGGATLFLVQRLLDALGVSVYGTQIAYGVVLILALAANSVAEKRRRSVRRESVPVVNVESSNVAAA